MTIKSKLEEADRCLLEARRQALNVPDSKLEKTILKALMDCRAALALANPGDAWLEETNATWDRFSGVYPAIIRFAAKTAARELEKYAEARGINIDNNPIIYKQIADLDAIAKGGGE